MNSSTASPAQLGGAQALVQHLREHPEDCRLAPNDLAGRFSLQESLVADVLQGVRQESLRLDEPAREGGNPFGGIAQTAQQLLAALTRHPIQFVAVTSILSIGLFLALSRFTVEFGLATIFKPNERALITLGLLTLTLHLVCYFRHAQARIAIQGAIVCWVISSITAMSLAWVTRTPANATGLIGNLLVVSTLMLIITIQYGSIGLMAAVLGGYVRVRHDILVEERMGRQELLQRLFDLREQLANPEEAKPARARFFEQPWVRGFRRHQWEYVALLGLTVSLLSTGALQGAGFSLIDPASQGPLALLVLATVMFMNTFLMVGISYLAGSFWRALALLAVMSLATYPPLFLPWGPGVHEFLMQSLSRSGVFRIVVFSLFVAGVGTLGAKVEERAQRQRRLRSHDPAAILAEMVRLEWRLAAGSHEVCVVVVDAAKSSEMKANSDPLVAEYSFREYQRMIDSICAEHGGRVHSTAGDGAVLAFDQCETAYQAAREIQTEIARFNVHTNRMNTPFRLRIGLHMGPITGDLSKVEYTEVIDIAAHVEGAAPVGGILVSEAVAARLPGENLVPLRDPVDGHRVHLVYNPTVDS